MARLSYLRKAKSQFCTIKSTRQLARLLKTELYQLELMAHDPKYHIFYTPKKDGSKRLIEDPVGALQLVQEKLNHWLGAAYFFNRTDAAFGFVLSVKSDPDTRNIATNAQRHIGCKYLYNADLKDFFHQISKSRIHEIFSHPPFCFEHEVAELLSGLTTFKGRLPMGAPTSPVLSNFATIELDNELLQLAQWGGWQYTRYADDMSFSSSVAFSDQDLQRIHTITKENRFEFNERKSKRYRVNDVKLITGIEVRENNIHVPDSFIRKLSEELIKLGNLIEVANRMGRREKWIDKYQQQVEGKVAFVQFVHGASSEIGSKMEYMLADALNPPDEFGAESWLDFGYF